MKVLNVHLGKTKLFVGLELSLADIYFVMTQIEMQQCLMDRNTINSLQNINGVFKTVSETTEFI